MKLSTVVCLCLLSSHTCNVLAYDIGTHELLSVQALRSSAIADQSLLAKRGFHHAIDYDASPQKFPNSEGSLRSLINLVRDGAKFEDNTPRSINHFFNPRTGSALSINADDYVTSEDNVTLQAYLGAAVGAVNAVAVASPDWALGTLPPSHLSQVNSYVDLKNYFFQALTSTTGTNRAVATGLTFETLGRIVHHLQDMAAPQHVRNDAHLQLDTADAHCPASPTTWFWGLWCPVYARLRAPSTYESWTTTVQQTAGSTLTLTGYDPVYGSDFDGALAFSRPRDFWVSNGKGIAEFTNRNFLSPGTMTVAPPSLGAAVTMKVSDLCIGAIPSCEVAYDTDDSITFYPSTVDDQLRPTTGGPNPFAASESIFSWDLKQYRPGRKPERTVNRFTFAYDHAYLLPRAVGYSAGFINYFFRGDMKIELPDEGVYAVADQSPAACGSPCGFRKLKLKLTNVTPGIVNGAVTPGGEVIGAGTLWAVVKHHLNSCYQADLSGEYGGSAFAGDTCRSGDEFITVSAPYSVQSVNSSEPQTITFDFGLTPIPINASDIYLQVVFRGKLGMEDDAVAVSTVDTAEPNFFAFANMSDYAYDTVDSKYHQLTRAMTPKDMTNIRLQFDGGVGSPVATLAVLPGGGHAQVAYLTDKGTTATYIQYEYQSPDGANSPYAFTQPVYEFTADSDQGPYTRTCPVKKLRGLFRDDMFFVWQYVHGAFSWVLLPGNAVGSDASPGTIQASGLRAKAASGGAICRPIEDLTGVDDFSAMTPQAVGTASAWNINF